MPPKEIFDRHARRLARGRMLDTAPEDRWIVDRMAEEILERLAAIHAPLFRALVIGCPPGFDERLLKIGMTVTVADPSFRLARTARGVQCDEDRLPFADQAFDLVVSIGSLDTVNDLPGALILARRVLRPDGLLLAAMAGSGSLGTLRSASAHAAGGVARFHPQIEVRAAGDLLARAGFDLPVADMETVKVQYRSFARLAADLRVNGMRNQLAQRRPLSRAEKTAMADAFGQGSRTLEQIGILVLTGWAPPLQKTRK